MTAMMMHKTASFLRMLQHATILALLLMGAAVLVMIATGPVQASITKATGTGTEPAPTSAVQDTITHTVESGQTLFRISRIYEVSVDDIMRWNQLETTTLEVGQELQIRGVEREAGSETPAEAADPENGRGASLYYEVKSGDTLYRIASLHNMSVDELMELNDLEDEQLEVGQRLQVRSFSSPTLVLDSGDEDSPQGAFVSYTVQEDDILPEILERFQMNRDEFEALNPKLDYDDLRSGDRIALLTPPDRQRSNPYRARTGTSDDQHIEVTVYDANHTGETTTSGELYNPEALTAGHPSLSMGSVVFVRNQETGKGVFVLINDRVTGDHMKLSQAAYEKLGYPESEQHDAIVMDATNR